MMNTAAAAARIRAGLAMPDLTLIDRDCLQQVRDLQVRQQHAILDPKRSLKIFECLLDLRIQHVDSPRRSTP